MNSCGIVYALLVGIFLLAGCGSDTSHSWQTDKTYHLTVLHTNDHHGRFWQNKYGEYGMAARKTLIDNIRTEVAASGGSLLLLSGGDINTGVPESDLQDAEPDFKGMSKIGYDAMALGNHEFDNPLSVLDKQIGWANFSMLSANIYDKTTNKRMFQPYQMFNKQGVKIAVIGLTTEDTVKIGNPEYISHIEFRDPKQEAKKLIKELKATEQPDLIFAVTHMGHYANAKNGINAPGDVALARFLDEGALHMIVGGHSQEPVCMEGNDMDANFAPGSPCKPDFQNGTYIVQAHEWGKYVGRADFEFKNGNLTLTSYKLIPVNLKQKVEKGGKTSRELIGQAIPQDKELLAFLESYQQKGQAQLNIKIAETNGKLEGDRDQVRFRQTNLGRLIAFTQMEVAKADFGIMNSGGVRGSIAAGDVTYKDVLTVLPFANIVTYTDMKGQELLDYLTILANKPVDSGAYAHFYGLSMTVENNKLSNILIQGKPFDPTRSYRFTLPSFNAAGGDGYPVINDLANHVDTGLTDSDTLRAYLEKNTPINVNAFAPNDEIVYQ